MTPQQPINRKNRNRHRLQPISNLCVQSSNHLIIVKLSSEEGQLVSLYASHTCVQKFVSFIVDQYLEMEDR